MLRCSIIHINDSIRHILVPTLCKLTLRVYIAINNEEFDLEGLVRFESSRGYSNVQFLREFFNHLVSFFLN